MVNLISSVLVSDSGFVLGCWLDFSVFIDVSRELAVISSGTERCLI